MTSQPPSTFHIGSGAGDSQGSALQSLDRRSREIFRRIVESYLETGEPVGSRNVSRLLPVSLSPASVRNVMADLEQLGLIYAPHTSAGRLPTEQGLRFFVDALLEIGDLAIDERRQIEAQMRAAEPGRNMESLLNEASQALSGLSRGAGVVLAGKNDLRLKHVEFVRIEPTRALVVLVGEDGSVENRLIDLDRRHHAIGADRGRQLPQHSAPRPDAVRGEGGARTPRGGLAERARPADRQAGRCRPRHLGRGRRRPPGDADRARPRQPFRGRHRSGGP